MTDVDVVTICRAAIIELNALWTEPHELAFALDRLATVPFDGDIDTYVIVAVEVVRAALEAAIKSRLEAMRARTAALQADNAMLEALNALPHMPVSKTIH